MAYRYRLAGSIRNRQLCFGCAHSRLDCLDSSRVRSKALPTYAAVLGSHGFRRIHQRAG